MTFLIYWLYVLSWLTAGADVQMNSSADQVPSALGAHGCCPELAQG